MPGIDLKKYVVRLSVEERRTLEAIVRKGTHPASEVLKAQILLKPIFPRLVRAGVTSAS